jgi:hypothetical protein
VQPDSGQIEILDDAMADILRNGSGSGLISIKNVASRSLVTNRGGVS